MLDQFIYYLKPFNSLSIYSVSGIFIVIAIILHFASERNRLTLESGTNILTYMLKSIAKSFLLFNFTGYYTTKYFSSLAFFTLKQTPLNFILCFVLVDFIKYVQHYCEHHFTIFRLGHTVHHSVTNFDITAALRVSMILHRLMFMVPIFLLGFSADTILLCVQFQFVYATLIHINFDHPFLRKLESAVFTPRLHKIHHSIDNSLNNKNLGTIFVIWDKFFKTYNNSKELDDITIGLSMYPRDLNPITIQLRPFAKYLKKAAVFLFIFIPYSANSFEKPLPIYQFLTIGPHKNETMQKAVKLYAKTYQNEIHQESFKTADEVFKKYFSLCEQTKSPILLLSPGSSLLMEEILTKKEFHSCLDNKNIHWVNQVSALKKNDHLLKMTRVFHTEDDYVNSLLPFLKKNQTIHFFVLPNSPLIYYKDIIGDLKKRHFLIQDHTTLVMPQISKDDMVILSEPAPEWMKTLSSKIYSNNPKIIFYPEHIQNHLPNSLEIYFFRNDVEDNNLSCNFSKDFKKEFNSLPDFHAFYLFKTLQKAEGRAVNNDFERNLVVYRNNEQKLFYVSDLELKDCEDKALPRIKKKNFLF